MVFNCVTRCCSLWLVRLKDIGGQLWHCPYIKSYFCQPTCLFFDSVFGPLVKLTKSFIEFDRTFLEAARHIRFLSERPVTVLRVVASECEVSKSMQPCLMNSFPLQAKFRFPGGGEVLILWHDMLDGVLIYQHTF